NAFARMHASLNGQPDPLLPADQLNPDVPAAVAAALARALTLRANARFPSAAHCTARPGQGTRARPGRRAPDSRRHRGYRHARLPAAGLAGLAVGLLKRDKRAARQLEPQPVRAGLVVALAGALTAEMIWSWPM